MKIIIPRLLLLALFTFSVISNSSADNVNPPKIESVTQITKGPYKPGDLIQFELSISGGAPKLTGSGISSDCFVANRSDQMDPTYYDPKYSSITTLTYIISSNCPNGINHIDAATLWDITNLYDQLDWSNHKLPSWQFEVINKYRQPPGVIQPNFDFSKDKVTLQNFLNRGSDNRVNKIVWNSKYIVIDLPTLTDLGIVINWRIGQYSNNCRFTNYRFPGDQRQLELFGIGGCELVGKAMYPNTGVWTEIGKPFPGNAEEGFYSFAVYSEVAKSKTEITCVKGKTTKKVTGINPQCPKGYKKAA